ncbi:MAG TPA: hypothetical protein VF755_01110 [Catenuloplanes sp.]|jgi:hypothetical protein
MRVRCLTAAVTAALTLSGGGVLVTSAAALAGPAFVAAESASPDDAAADLELVWWLAQEDERAIVRSTAMNAVLDPAGEPAIRRFLESEFEYAEEMAADTSARNKDFVDYVLATYLPEFAREVHAAATFAAGAGDSACEVFVQSGYAAAKERDRRVRDTAGGQAAALAQADRLFVAGVRDRDPGPYVRVAAGWALREGAVDGDVVEFFTHGWGAAAGLDLRAHRTALAGSDVRWRQVTRQLVIDAEAAEKAARKAAGEAAVQARATAARAWRDVRERSTPAREAWVAAEQVALAQAETWKRVAEAAAAAAKNPNWKPIAGTVEQLRAEWAVEQKHTTAQADYWTNLNNRAQAGERAMQTPAG